MRAPNGQIPLAGSERPRSTDSKLLKQLDANQLICITLLIRQRPGSPVLPDLEYWQRIPPHKRQFLSPEDFAATYGAAQADLDTAQAFVEAQGMTVLDAHAGRRLVSVQGTAAQMNAAFGIQLNSYESPAPRPTGREHRSGGDKKPSAGARATTQVHHGYDGPVYLPHELAAIVIAVVGLDNRAISVPEGSGDPANSGPLSVPTVAGLYNFPNPGAQNEVIGVFAPQSTTHPWSSNYSLADITSYIGSLPAAYRNQPVIVDVPLTVGTTTFANNPALVSAVPANSTMYTNNAYAYILEVTQDISTIAAVAQGATINVYFTEDSEQGYFTFLSRLLLPGTEAQPSVVSISFSFATSDRPGIIGDAGTPGTFASIISGMFQQLAAQGICVFVAAGDNGADNAGIGSTRAQYPASDPWITSCGGTIVGNIGGGTFEEYVWSDANTNAGWFDFTGGGFGTTGGGASRNFPVPPYQTAAGITGATDSAGNVLAYRVFPDVAGMVAYDGFIVNGLGFHYFGTSCVAPLYAGLMAILLHAFGSRVGFLNPTLYALGNTVCNDITNGNNQSSWPSVASAPYYTAGPGFDPCSGWGSIDGAKLLNGIAGIMYAPSLYFVVDKSSYGFDEVGVVSSYPDAFWLVLEGFTPNAVGSVVPTTPAGAPSGVTITAGAGQPELALFPNTPQRILFQCSVDFTAGSIQAVQAGVFPAPGSAPIPVSLDSTMTVPGQAPLHATTSLELVAGADPYFTNINTAANNVFYLSQDLRVFTVTPGENSTPVAGVTGAPQHAAGPHLPYDTNAGFKYMKDLLNYLNTNYNDPAGPDPFLLLPDQSDALYGVSSVAPTAIDPANAQPTDPRFANYSYGIARVRMNGEMPNSSTAKNVRVLFRMFATETSDTDFTHDHYPSTPDAAGHPLSPLPGTGNVTIPFFGTGNYEAGTDFGINVDYSANSVNNQPMKVAASGNGWAYYGCYLNVYPPANTIGGQSVQSLLPGTHHCLVAEISFDDAPIASSNGINASPENSDKLAQRNLNITYSDNPGPRETHRVPQTFDTRPSAAFASGKGELLDYPDELMIHWGNTPAGSTASIYWPQVHASEVLALAKELYSTHQLSAADAHTIQCRVPRGVTYVPIPPGSGENFAGLFTVDLPQTVVTGQELNITVRRIATRRTRLPGTAGGEAGGSAVAGNKRGTMRNWRYVVGTFAVRIPVTTAKVMLPAEENILAIMKWRLEQMQRHNRWVPVMRRYISYIEGRIDGLGGNAKLIEPSPYGVLSPVAPGPGRGHEYTGKVNGVVYDRFGDFEGFLLLTEEGHERAFLSREGEIEKLVRFAWIERVVITVITDEHRSSQPRTIILRRAPRE